MWYKVRAKLTDDIQRTIELLYPEWSKTSRRMTMDAANLFPVLPPYPGAFELDCLYEEPVASPSAEKFGKKIKKQ